MIGYLSILVFLHTALSTLRWRKYVQASQAEFFLPIDVRPCEPRLPSNLG